MLFRPVEEVEVPVEREPNELAAARRRLLVIVLSVGIAVAVLINTVQAMNDEAVARGLNILLAQIALILAALTTFDVLPPSNKE